MPQISLDLRGTKAFSRSLSTMGARTILAATQALVIEGETVMTEAKRETPIQFGVLRSSGRVSAPRRKGTSLSVRLSFGGPAQDYAIYVHEDLEARHTSGNAKFLEGPVKRHAAKFSRNIALRIAKTLKAT